MPRAVEASASAGLPLGRDYGAAWGSPRGQLEQHGIGRVHRFAKIEGKAPGVRSELALHRGALEQRERQREAIAAPPHLVDLESRRFEVAHRVPDRGARDVERARE